VDNRRHILDIYLFTLPWALKSANAFFLRPLILICFIVDNGGSNQSSIITQWAGWNSGEGNRSSMLILWAGWM